MRLTVLLASFLFSNQFAFAEICTIHVKRNSCPGKDMESYIKCGGKQECDEKKAAKTLEECAALAKKECDNTRINITKSKEITAMFQDKKVEDGKNVCAGDRADFNKCS